MRRRINLSVSERMYNDLQRYVRKYRFGGICEMMVALASIMLRRLDELDEAPDMEETDEEYIDSMFKELENYEPTPEAGHAPVIRRPRKEV